MVDLAKWCLLVCYYYGRFTGVLNFEIDLKTGRARVTKRATICAACSQLAMFILLGYHSLHSHTMTSLWSNANHLHEYVFVIMASFRMICVFLALVSRWCQRRRFIRLFNSFRRLYQSNPDIINYCRRGIVSKCLCATMSETLQVVMALILLRNDLTLPMALGIWAVLSLTAIINVIITQYFIAMANIRGRYILLNKELRSLMADAQSLVPDRSGVYVTRCCSLADRLEEIAQTQSELQDLTERLSRTYQVQVLCVSITYYLNWLGNVYMVFSIVEYRALSESWPKIVMVFGTFYMVFYYLDCWLNSFNIFYLLDTHKEMVELLGLRTLLQPGLDCRLEAVVSGLG